MWAVPPEPLVVSETQPVLPNTIVQSPVIFGKPIVVISTLTTDQCGVCIVELSLFDSGVS